MAITVLSVPPALALVKNPLPFRLKSNNIVVEEPSSSYTDIFISAGATVVAGDTIRFQWGENDITFIARDSLIQDGQEFPTGVVDLPYCQSVADSILQNFTVAETFTIEVTFLAAQNRYQFRVKFIATGNLSVTIRRTIAADGGLVVASPTFTGDPGEIRSDFQYYYEVYASDLVGGFDRIYGGRQSPGENDEAVIDVSGPMQAVMRDVDFPRHDSAAITRCVESRRQYYIRYGEYYGGQVRSTYKSSSFVALSGGYDLQNYPGSDFVAYLTAAGGRQFNRFLLYDNDPVIARTDQPEFLSFVNLHADITTLKVRVTITFTDDTTSTFIALSQATGQYDKLHIPAGYSQLQLGTVDPLRQVKEWTITLLDQKDAVSSETRTYLLKTKPELATRYFLYSTSLGAIKTLRTAGTGSQELEVFKSKATKVLPYDYKAEDGSSFDYNQTFEDGEAVATGFLIRRQVMGLTDLFRSRHKFRVTGGKQLPVVINTNTIKLGADRQNQYSVKFEYRFLFENTEFTDPYINLPASENSDVRQLLDPQPALPEATPGGDTYEYWVLKAGLDGTGAPDPGINVFKHQDINIQVDSENPFMTITRTSRGVVFSISMEWFAARFLSNDVNFDGRYWTKIESDIRYASIVHNHDDRYYTKSGTLQLFYDLEKETIVEEVGTLSNLPVPSSYARFTGQGQVILTGVDIGSLEGKSLLIRNETGQELTVIHAAVSSIEKNRFYISSNEDDLPLGAGCAAWFKYSLSQARWQLVDTWGNGYSPHLVGQGQRVVTANSDGSTAPEDTFLYEERRDDITVPQNSASLNALYPDAPEGFHVRCMNIVGGGRIYKKEDEVTGKWGYWMYNEANEV